MKTACPLASPAFFRHFLYTNAKGFFKSKFNLPVINQAQVFHHASHRLFLNNFFMHRAQNRRLFFYILPTVPKHAFNTLFTFTPRFAPQLATRSPPPACAVNISRQADYGTQSKFFVTLPHMPSIVAEAATSPKKLAEKRGWEIISRKRSVEPCEYAPFATWVFAI